MRIRLLALILVVAASALAQFDPEDAEVISYFPHVTDGGPPTQRWITALTLGNPHSTLFASGTVYLYGDNGKPLFLDFGHGPVSTIYFAIPPQGTAEFQTIGASSTAVNGWATVTSTLPVQGVIRLRFTNNGVPQQGASEHITRASMLFRSPASPNTGVAIANVNSTSLTVTASALDANGGAVAVASVVLAPLGHTALTVRDLFPGLPASFAGSLLIAATVPGNYCVAWTLSADLGIISGDPPSGLGWPVSQYERIWKVWRKLVAVASVASPLPVQPKLVIETGTDTINAVAKPSSNEIDLFLNLAELVADSDSELSFMIGHELGHILQSKTGRVFVPLNVEADADDWAVALALQAGYDPYAAAGALGKLYMASSTLGLLDPNFDNLQAVVGLNVHKSFNDRLGAIFDGMNLVCGSPLYQPLCAKYKTTIHTHVPSPAPLSTPGQVVGSIP